MIPRLLRMRLLIFTSWLALLNASPGVLQAQEQEPSEEPRILLFRVLQTAIRGEPWHEFHWEVSETVRVQLFKEGREIPGRSQLADGTMGWPLSMSGSLRMQLTGLTEFELLATNRAGDSVRKKFTVKGVDPGPPREPPADRPEHPAAPRIESFRVSPATPEPGGWIEFSWEVRNTELVRLYEGGSEIDLRGLETGDAGVLSTTIDETTTFRLEAVGRSRTATSRTLTVEVKESARPGASCTIWGQLEGKWRQEIRERPTGPASTWTVEVYGYVAGSERAVANATVDHRGVYRFSGLTAGKSYRVRPVWESTPRQANVSCSSGETRRGPSFKVVGGPKID